MTVRIVQPTQKIQTYVDLAVFGDSVIVEDSVRTNEFVKMKQGVSLRPRNPRGVLLNGGAILADGISSIDIGAFHIYGSPGYGGIIVFGPGKDCRIDSPFIERTKNSGIAFWGTDQIRNQAHDPTDGRPGFENYEIISPEIRDCVDGGGNEQITLAANLHYGLLYEPYVYDTYDVAGKPIANRDGGGEGIDPKIFVTNLDIVRPHIKKTAKHPIYIDGAVADVGPGWVYKNILPSEYINVWDMLIEDCGDSVRFGTEGSGTVNDINFIGGRIIGTRNGKASLLGYLPSAPNHYFRKNAQGQEIVPASPKRIGIYGVTVTNPSGKAIEANFPGIEIDDRNNSHQISGSYVKTGAKIIWPNPGPAPSPRSTIILPPPPPVMYGKTEALRDIDAVRAWVVKQL